MGKYGIEHILMTADAVGGVWTYCLDLARELARHDVRVSLAVMGPGPSERQREDAALVPNLSLHVGEFKLEWMDDPWSDVDRASDWLLSLASRLKPDLVHLNGYCHAALPWPAPTMVVCHSDVFAWWEAVKQEPAPEAEWAEYKRRVRTGLQSAGMVVAPTAAALGDAQRLYGPFENARVIYNGRTASLARTPDKREMVLAAGRIWDEAKNISALAQVAPSLSWPVYVAGDGATVAGVHHLGKLCPGAMASWMGKASIYALPVKYEPFGLSILEAALAECALVLGDIPTMRELWDGAAVFVNPHEPDAVEIGINYLIKNNSVREQLARAACNRAQLYSSRAFGCGYLFAYQDLKQGSELLQVSNLAGVSLL
jgi:glycosyltransferase involved in cell wall biosynthesis